MRGATCHLFFERLFVALVYQTPVAQIVTYHSQQVVWNIFPHYRLDADVPPCGIERIAYVNADQRAESLTLTSSSFCFSGNVHHCLDGVNFRTAFPKAELFFRETVLADHTAPTRSLHFFESEEFFAPDHAGTSILSVERLYVWKQALHDVLDSIGIIQARGRSSPF